MEIINDLLKEYRVVNPFDYDFLETIYPELILDKWVHLQEKRKDYIINEHLLSWKKVDKETYLRCYCRYFNPIEITINALTGAPVKHDSEGHQVYNMRFGICTVDDSWWGVRFNELNYYKLTEIREKLIEEVDKMNYVNYENVISIGEQYGGTNESW